MLQLWGAAAAAPTPPPPLGIEGDMMAAAGLDETPTGQGARAHQGTSGGGKLLHPHGGLDAGAPHPPHALDGSQDLPADDASGGHQRRLLHHLAATSPSSTRPGHQTWQDGHATLTTSRSMPAARLHDALPRPFSSADLLRETKRTAEDRRKTSPN
jgi:hypothetical protein